jgi:hypothetical protein
MKQGRVIISDFTETIKRSLDNSLNFENHSLFEKYDFHEDYKKIGSVLNLCVSTNYILETLIPHLREVSPIESMNEEDRKRFNRNPMKLSYYKYGVIDYWWILLSVNGYFNAAEFHDFLYLRIPNKADIGTILDREVFTDKPYGIIPE